MTSSLRISVLMLFLCTGAFSLHAQKKWQKVEKEEAVKALSQINEKMEAAKTLKVDIAHQIIDLSDSSTYMKSEGFFARKDSLLFRSKSFGVEVMQNKDCRVVIDGPAKTLVVSNSAPTSSGNDPAMIQTYFSKYTVSGTFRSTNERGETSYLITFEGENSPIYALSFSFSSDFLLSEIMMDLNQSVNPAKPKAKSRTVIRFTNYAINKSIPNAYFSADFAVENKKGKFLPAPEYAGFEFINTYR